MDGAADDPTLGQGDASTSNSSTDPIPEHIASLFTLSKLKAISSADDYICELVADTLQEFTIHTGVAPAAEAGRDDLPHSALPTQSLEDNAFGKSEALLRRVERAKADLRKLEVEANKKVDELEEDLVCQDIDYQTSKSELEDSQEELVESFEELDGEVSILSNIAARIGERLETAEVQRKRAEDTVELILYIQEFAAKPGDLSSLSDIFTNDTRFAEAAPLARNLLTLVEGMAGSMGTTTTADAGAVAWLQAALRCVSKARVPAPARFPIRRSVSRSVRQSLVERFEGRAKGEGHRGARVGVGGVTGTGTLWALVQTYGVPQGKSGRCGGYIRVVGLMWGEPEGQAA
ncbi:Exocyst complex component 5 [Cymbomonas tetramitiformis]|uniref:Exocyst complex component 5 n=1 Tax=Cymbomonas tetramitiformis TaxID=36881 RepID=A0AAE0GNN7_9CHLO|nr:Exocyst complex component 5 [Cymbomonas tetramitiformis]